MKRPPRGASRPPLVTGGVSIQRHTLPEALEAALSSLDGEPMRLGWVYANCVNIARTNPLYRAALNRFELLLNDGVGIELAGRLLGRPVLGNLNGTDLIPGLFDRLQAQQRPVSVFVLGSRSEVLDKLPALFASRWPLLRLSGTHHGFFKEPSAPLPAIEMARPDILLVTMGVPRQEVWIDRSWARLTASGVKLAIAGGAVVDFLTGSVARAPQWIQQVRLEWLYRLSREPGRLWPRYVNGNARYLFELWREWRARPD